MPYLDRLKEVRERAGLNQGELAERIRMAPVAISHIERVQRNVREDTLNKIAEALEVEPSKLFTEEGQEEVETRSLEDPSTRSPAGRFLRDIRGVQRRQR